MSRRQHHKGKKRPRSWHHTWKTGRHWLRAMRALERL